MAGYIPNAVMITHPNTNRARHRLTSLIKTDSLPLPTANDVIFLLQDAAGSVGQSKVSTAPLVTDVGLGEHASLNGLSGVPVITAVPCSKVEESEDWKCMETEDWNGWKEEAREPAAAHGGDGLPVASAEPVTAASNGEVCDSRQTKPEQALNYGAVGTSASTSEARPGRVIASVAPCAPVQPSRQPSPWKAPLPGAPPPLLHSSHDRSSPSPLPTSVIQSPVVASDETSPLSQNDSDDSEQELRNRTPSPEPRPVNEECCRSKNAMYAVFITMSFFKYFSVVTIVCFGSYFC